MLFSKHYIIKLYYDGQTEPFIVFTIEGQRVETIDAHTIKSDGSTIKFGESVFVAVIG